MLQELLLETQKISSVYLLPALKKCVFKAVGTPQLRAFHQHIFGAGHAKPGIGIIDFTVKLIRLLHIKIRPVSIHYFIKYHLSIHFILHMKSVYDLK